VAAVCERAGRRWVLEGLISGLVGSVGDRREPMVMSASLRSVCSQTAGSWGRIWRRRSCSASRARAARAAPRWRLLCSNRWPGFPHERRSSWTCAASPYLPSRERVRALDGIRLRVTDLGPNESPHDSIWALEDSDRQVFSADLAYDRHHCYLADGFHQEWLQNLRRAQSELPAGVTLHAGHGEPCGAEVLDWQEGCINTSWRQ
jgi:hypothetical protein